MKDTEKILELNPEWRITIQRFAITQGTFADSEKVAKRTQRYVAQMSHQKSS